jgi:hypothetical protein
LNEIKTKNSKHLTIIKNIIGYETSFPKEFYKIWYSSNNSKTGNSKVIDLSDKEFEIEFNFILPKKKEEKSYSEEMDEINYISLFEDFDVSVNKTK